MKREDFKQITEEHIKIAKKIAKIGDCIGIECKDCPFGASNETYPMDCNKRYSMILLAKEFVKLFDKPEEKSLNFYEKLSAILYDKQILFKQDDGIYYNKNTHDTMTKKEVKEWLLAEVGELNKN